MKVRLSQNFNMFNTNGRRKDIFEAYRIYLEILQDLEKEGLSEFTNYPNSLAQFRFYQEAIKRSPDVFKTYKNYDKFMGKLTGLYKEYFYGLKFEEFKNLKNSNEMLKTLDDSIEVRARHYTSNLEKIGFVDSNRKISPVGNAFVNNIDVKRDGFEEILPIKNTNLIFLRQLLKLRIYTNEEDRYYSPIFFAIYLLLIKDKISVNNFREMVQQITPYKTLNHEEIDEYINNNLDNNTRDFVLNYQRGLDYIGNEFKENEILPYKDFKKYINNKKSESIQKEYYDFYKILRKFRFNENMENLQELMDFYKNSKYIDLAFKNGRKLFNINKISSLDEFQKNNKNNILLTVGLDNFNNTFYQEFYIFRNMSSQIEYSDTLMRIINVSGIVRIKNGIIYLENKRLWELLNEFFNFKEYIFGTSTKEDYRLYEGGKNSVFTSNLSLLQILGISDLKASILINKIKDYLGVDNIKNGRQILAEQVNREFIQHIEINFPKDKTIELLKLFSDRDNDSLIKREIKSDASIPTIFEYICGIALFYMRNEEYNVFDSFNLTMNSDFLPETHAGGGDGDIIARFSNKSVMLEVTLMNKMAQKRGEWEPVLRHSANLVIDEAPRPVYTLFIADEFDDNTINIWRAVATVPLKSSKEVSTEGKTAENVKILPVTGNELSDILETNKNIDHICESMDESFKPLISNFDLYWREKIMDTLI